MTFYRVDLGRHSRMWLAYRDKANDVAKVGSKEYRATVKVQSINVDPTQVGILKLLNGSYDLTFEAAYHDGQLIDQNREKYDGLPGEVIIR